jgi:cobalt/nickel transport system permease protein
VEKIQHRAYDLGYLDTLSRQRTPIHRIDPRAKVITTLAFLAFVLSFDKYTLSALVPFFLYPLVIAAIGDVPLAYIGRKVAFIAPLAALLGIFNPVLDRHPIMMFDSVSMAGGWVSFCSIILRAVLTVGAAMTLIAVTGMQPLCAALDRLRVPRVFVVQLMFLYRYLFVLVEEATRMARARTFRSADRRGGGLKVYGSLVGHLLLRTYDRAERIYLAMVSRGFTGEIKLLQPLSLGARDLIFLLGWLVFFVFIRMFNVAHLSGEFILGVLRSVTIL